MQPRWRRACGFTLLETVVASAILAVALLTTAGLLLSGMRLAAEARHATVALTVAASVAEQLHGLGLQQAVRAFDSGGCRPASERRCSFDPTGAAGGAGLRAQLDRAFDEGRAEVRLRALDGSALDDAIALRAEVEISWREGARRRAIVLVAVRGS